MLHILALAGLLAQAAFAAVSPAAVLCISSHLSDCHEHALAEQCESHTCCEHNDAPDDEPRLGVAIAAPCNDQCLQCVDVALPDEVTWNDGWRVVLPDLPALPLAAFHTERLVAQLPTLCIEPCGTGPPALRAYPHAPVMKTTRLLI